MKPCKRSPVRKLLWGAFGVLLLAACGNPEDSANATTQQPEKVVPIAVETVTPVDLTDAFMLPASLEAWEDLVLSAEIAGPVRAIHFEEGQRVEAGSILLEINPETLESQRDRDEENFAVSRRKLARYRELYDEGLVSDQELDELENSLTAAEVALKATRLQLAKCYPEAPVDGVVDRHFVDRGEYVDPGTPLMRLVQIDQLKVVADVPEKDVPFLKAGQQVAIIPAVINDLAFAELSGEIVHVALAADESTRTYRTKIRIDNAAGQLRPGMIVRARFVRRQLQQVVAVPLYAVLDRDGDKVVFVEEDGRARRLQVETGGSVGQRIVIRSGLEPGQRLVVEGQQLLADGARVAPGEN